MKKQKILAFFVVFAMVFAVAFTALADETVQSNLFAGLLAQCSGEKDDSRIEYLTNGWNENLSAHATVYNADGTDCAWVQFSFSEKKTVNKIFLQQKWVETEKAPLSRVADIAVDVRLATGGWKRVASQYDIQSFFGGHTFTFTPVEVLAVRISANGNRYGTDTFCITEIEGYYDKSVTAYTGIGTPDDETYAVPDGFADMNLISNLVATSSNTDDSVSDKYPITNLTDGKIGKAACVTTDTKTNTAWVQFELPDSKDINKVVINQAQGEDFTNIKDFAVDVMESDGMWRRVAEEYNVSDTAAPSVITFTPIKATAIRITAGALRTQSTVFSITEAEVFYDGTVTEYTGVKTPDKAAYKIEMTFDKINIFSGLTAQYSKYGFNEVSYLTDGQKGNGDRHFTIKNADGTNCAWVQFNLKDAKLIDKVFIQQKWNYETNKPMAKAVDWAVDVKLASGGWKRVAAVYDITSTYNPLWLTFEPVKVSAVRVTASGVRNNLSYICLTEVEGYCDSTVTSYSGVNTPTNSSYAVPEVLSTMNLLSGIIADSSNTSSWFATDRPVKLLTDGVTGPSAALASITNAGTTTHAWVRFDLPEVKPINKVIVQQRAYEGGTFPRNKDLAVDVLLADGNWKRVASEYNLASTYNQTVFTFEPVRAAAVRVTTNGKRENSANFNVTEISAYYDSSVTSYSGVKDGIGAEYYIPLVPDLENLLWGLVPISSNTNTWFDTERPVSSLTNGVAGKTSLPASITNCGTSKCAWLVFTLPTARDVNKVIIQQRDFENGLFPQVKDIAVDVLISGGGWKRVAATYNIEDTSKLAVLTFEKVNVTAIRIVTSSRRTGGWGFSATEIEAYCDSKLTAYSGLGAADSDEYKIVEICQLEDLSPLENLFIGADISSSPSDAALSKSKELSYINDAGSSSIDPKYAAITFNDGVAWYTVNMKQSVAINTVILQNSMYEQPAVDIAVDVLLADGNWKRVAAKYDIKECYQNIKFVFEPIDTTAVRITASGKRNGCENFALSGIAGYHNPADTEYTGIGTPDKTEFSIPNTKRRLTPAAKFDNLSTSGKGPYVPTP